MNLPPQVVRRRKSVYALVLAAGRSARFGATKQTVGYNGIPLVRRAVAAAATVCPGQVALVVGHDARAVAHAAGPFDGKVVENERYREGLGSSIAAGVRAVRDDADAIFVLLADQPLVTAAHLQALIDVRGGDANEIVATSFSDTQGPPVLFASGCFDALSELRGDTGARALFNDQRFTLTAIPFEDAAIDIDRPEDLKRS